MKKKSTAFRLWVLVACLLPLQARAAESTGSAGPSFQIVVTWLLDLPPILRFLPDWAATLLGIDYAATVSLDGGFPATRIERLDDRHVELRHLEGLALLVEHDAQGRVGAGTRLILAPKLSDRPQKLRCRPKTEPAGFWFASWSGADAMQQGRFFFQLAHCEEESTGTVVDWPRRPIAVRGTFAGLPALSIPPRLWAAQNWPR